MARHPQAPPWEGAKYDPKSRGWYDSQYPSYKAAPAASKLSRRQYDKQYGSLKAGGYTSYERKAADRVKVGRQTDRKGWANVPVSLTGDATLADLLAKCYGMMPGGMQFIIDAIGTLNEDGSGDGEQPDVDEEEARAAEQDRDTDTKPIAGEYEWRTVLPQHLSNDLGTHARQVEADLRQGIRNTFQREPAHYVLRYRPMQDKPPQPRRRQS